MTEDQTKALDRLPQFYTPGDVVDLVFLGDHDAFVDAWVARTLPARVRKACEELITPDQQIAWYLQRTLAVLTEARAVLEPLKPWIDLLARTPIPEDVAAPEATRP